MMWHVKTKFLSPIVIYCKSSLKVYIQICHFSKLLDYCNKIRKFFLILVFLLWILWFSYFKNHNIAYFELTKYEKINRILNKSWSHNLGNNIITHLHFCDKGLVFDMLLTNKGSYYFESYKWTAHDVIWLPVYKMFFKKYILGLDIVLCL